MKIELNRKNDRIVIATTEFMGKKYVDIRSYYFKDEEFKPGKGITLKTKEEVKFVLDALANNVKEIEQWLEYNPNNKVK